MSVKCTVKELYEWYNTCTFIRGAVCTNNHERALSLFVDLGGVMPTTRHGLSRLSTGPLVKSSFEQSVEILFEAGTFILAFASASAAFCI